jgi:hypothetical protein
VFFPRTERLDLTAERIHALRISLNAPVIGLAGIPTGPARASILVHDEADGRPQVTIGIRSLRSGDVVVFSFEGEFGGDLPLEVGIDAALSFAESMGFLFDDDEVQGRDAGARERARGLWVELMGAPPAGASGPADELFDHADLSDLRPDDSFQLGERQKPAPSSSLEPQESASAYETELELSQRSDVTDDAELELDLDDSACGLEPRVAAPVHDPVIDLATEAVELGPASEPELPGGEAVAAPEPPLPGEPALALDSFDLDAALQESAAESPAPVSTRGMLSKFRFAPVDEGAQARSGARSGAAPAGAASAAAHDAEEQAALSRTALGRVRLVKRRAAEGSGRLPPVARLLTSF